MSFSQFKKNKSDLTKLNKQIEDLDQAYKNKFKDDRFWSPTIDKAGNGSATIRFLPAADGEDLPWAQYHEHNFDIDGTYFIELCPTTLGRDCPVCKANSVLWKTETEENQKIVRKRKRALRYVSNILVLKDKDTPEAEGKVWLFRYGSKIFEKIKLQLKPKHEDDPAINVFDFWEGADFRLDIKKVSGFNNYDDSSFRPSTALFKGDDQKLETIYNSLYPLAPFTDPQKFKTYEEMEKKFLDVTEPKSAKIQKKADELFGEDSPKSSGPKKQKDRKAKEDTPEEAPWEKPVKRSRQEEPVEETVVEEDEFDYASLAE
jgi:hypothetical protein